MLKNKTKAKGESKKAKVKNKGPKRYSFDYSDSYLFLPFDFCLSPFALDLSCHLPSANYPS
jgi:hypothetical protein